MSELQLDAKKEKLLAHRPTIHLIQVKSTEACMQESCLKYSIEYF